MAQHEILTSGWFAEHARTFGLGISLIGASVVLMSLLPGDSKAPKPPDATLSMIISGLVTSAVGVGLHLLGKLGEEKDYF